MTRKGRLARRHQRLSVFVSNRRGSSSAKQTRSNGPTPRSQGCTNQMPGWRPWPRTSAISARLHGRPQPRQTVLPPRSPVPKAAEAERLARIRARDRRERRRREAETARAVIVASEVVLEKLDTSIELASDLR